MVGVFISKVTSEFYPMAETKMEITIAAISRFKVVINSNVHEANLDSTDFHYRIIPKSWLPKDT